jgi:hypothetical protein
VPLARPSGEDRYARVRTAASCEWALSGFSPVAYGRFPSAWRDPPASVQHELPVDQYSGFGRGAGKSLASPSSVYTALGGSDKSEYRFLKSCSAMARPRLTHQAVRCIVQRVYSSDPAELPDVDADGRLENDSFHEGRNVLWRWQVPPGEARFNSENCPPPIFVPQVRHQ